MSLEFCSIRNLILVILISLFTGCQKIEEPNNAYYFWRTQMELSALEKEKLALSESEFLYVRLFDVDKLDGEFKAVGTLQKADIQINKKIVPVIFIVNRVWLNITSTEIDFLAKKINQQINSMQFEDEIAPEIQIDSDWTAETKDDYFTFLNKLKEISNKNITCTIRLHQIKDREKTGIPPVDKGYLMCYATSSPLDTSHENSILNVNLLKSYLTNLSSYPLQLDMAFPIYSWGIVSNHLNKKKIINALSISDLEHHSDFERININLFRLKKDGFYFGLYLNNGFTIKIEEITEKDLQESITFINQNWQKPYQLIWYHLDERFITNYPNLLP